MAKPINYLAIDLGASNGRAMVGSFDGARVQLREVHRIPNGPTRLRGGLYWNAPRLLEEVRAALARCSAEGIELAGMGIDTWGVDYGLVGHGGGLLGLPRHYRDERTRGMIDAAAALVPREEIYAATGIQFMELNTLYQLMADAREDPGRLGAAQTLLFTPNLLAYWLTGERCAELSIASTSQVYDPRRRAWAAGLLDRLGLPARILPSVVPPATVLGPLEQETAAEAGVPRLPVILPACHDTACAVAATPGRGDDWAYVSCGTWSLVGVELDGPLCTPEAMRANFTNELGVGGSVRFLRNVAGLWLLQECRRAWAAAGRAYTFEQLHAMAADAPALGAILDADDPSFAAFGDMPARVRAAAARLGPAPADDGAVARCILDSLALAYRLAVEDAERLTGRRIATVHVVGGGVRERLLCQLTADATGRVVRAGPVEATAMGNVLVQALAQGRVGSLREIREAAAASEAQEVFEPGDTARWDAAAATVRGESRHGGDVASNEAAG